MIERYRDHAANERTYLAWIRTGITVMVLGFIVEKFELFLATLHGLLTSQQHTLMESRGPEIVSLALVLLGVFVIVAGAVRFVRVKRQLDAPEAVFYRGIASALWIALVLVGFGIYLLLYLARVV